MGLVNGMGYSVLFLTYIGNFTLLAEHKKCTAGTVRVMFRMLKTNSPNNGF